MVAAAIDPAEQRLHALLDLLIATGTDTDDNHHLNDRVSRFKSIHLSNIALPESRQPDDNLIEDIIGQLHKANNDIFDDTFPVSINTDPIPLTLRQSSLKLVTRPEALMQQEPISAPPPSADQLREFMEREDSYPRIGPGYSDEISVVSDLTIPTVVNGVAPVPDEEYYGAPRQLPLNFGTGGGNNMKRRNLVNAVKPQQPSLATGTPPPPPRRSQMPPGQGPPQQMGQRAKQVQRPGGAAAKRLKNYEQTMAKLGDAPGSSGAFGNEFEYSQDNDGSNFYMEPSSNGFGADWEEDAGQQMMMSGPGVKKRSPVPNRSKKQGVSPLAKSNVNQSIDMGRSPSKGSNRPQKDLEWQPPFGSPAFQSPKSGGEDPLLIDEDGFLVAEQAGGLFKSPADPFASTVPDPFSAAVDPFVKQRSFGSSNSPDLFNRGYADNAFSPASDPFQKPHKSPARPARAGRRMSNEMEYTMESEWAADPDPRSRRAPVNQGGRPRRAGPQ